MLHVLNLWMLWNLDSILIVSPLHNANLHLSLNKHNELTKLGTNKKHNEKIDFFCKISEVKNNPSLVYHLVDFPTLNNII